MKAFNKNNFGAYLVVFLWAAVLVILSNPASAHAAFRFGAWGDTKTGTSVFAASAQTLKGILPQPIFTVYTGDLCDSGSGCNTPTGAWSNALRPAGGPDYRATIFPIRGNHDGDLTGWQANFDLRGVAGLVGATNYTELNTDVTYSFDYENAHFVGIDITGDVTKISAAQIAWLDADLTAAEARGLQHAFLWWHGPFFAMDGHCCPVPPSSFINVLNKHAIVSATFHGHEHIYTYSHINASRVPGVTHEFEQFITGANGAGPSSYTASKADYGMPDKSGFVLIDVNGPSFTATFFVNGSSVPQYTKTFTKSGLPPPQGPYTLTVSKAGTGQGTISGGSINCGVTCTASLTAGTAVTLTATPAPGSTFAGWSGACSGTASCAITMDAAKSVTATFNTAGSSSNTVTVTRSGSGQGTVSGGGINCGSTCSVTVNPGTPITLSAVPQGANDRFTGWSGACSGTAPTCTFVVTTNATVGAQFTLLSIDYQLRVEKTGTGMGTVSGSGLN